MSSTTGDEPPGRRPMPPGDFDAAYAGTPPWDIGRPQPAFVDLAETGHIRGSVLDAGCGTGELTLMAGAMGLDAIGVDTAQPAIDIARQKALRRGVPASFLLWDALELPALNRRFDTVLDCGLFHVFDDYERERYVQSLAGVMNAGGRLHLLCFSDRVPGDFGPRRVSEEEIRSSFDGWQIDSIALTKMELTLTPDGVVAWLASMTLR
jgi:SAM-dependent methyltransferase